MIAVDWSAVVFFAFLGGIVLGGMGLCAWFAWLDRLEKRDENRTADRARARRAASGPAQNDKARKDG